MVLWMVEMEVADPERPERSGRIAHGLPTPSSGPCPDLSRQEDIARVPTQPTAGRTLVTRRAVIDIVRTATLGSYGVTGFAASPSTGCSAGSGSATRASASTSGRRSTSSSS